MTRSDRRPRRPSLRLPLLAALAVSVGVSAEEITVEQRLADFFARVSSTLLQGEFVTLATLDSAQSTMDLALELAPRDVELHRRAFLLATLREDDVRRERLLETIRSLDPADEVAALQSLYARLDQYGTVDERLEAYRTLLESDLPAKAPAIASRLALDRALLQRRVGDTEGFATSLAGAVAIDPSNRDAAALATGFFQLQLDDPDARVELLVNLLLADPSDTTASLTLARALAERGALRSAARLYRFIRSAYASQRQEPSSEFVADLALAEWGSGRPDAALRTLTDRRNLLNDILRSQMAVEQPDLSIPERSTMVAATPPVLEIVEAAIRRAGGETEASLACVRRALAGLEIEADDALAQDPPDRRLAAARLLERAWVMVGFDVEVDQVEPLLERADALEPIGPEARTRFEGWLALRRGEPARALDLLSADDGNQAMSALGAAEACLALDRPRDAARKYLEAARINSGSVVGVEAREALFRLVGARTSLSPSEERLEAIVDALPRSLDRYFAAPSLAFSARLESDRVVFEPGEPITVELVLENRSFVPLAIDRAGPIRPVVMLEVESSLRGGGLRDAGNDPIIVEIDRRLRLEPGEQLRIPVRLNRTSALGRALDERMIYGGFVRLNAITNPRIGAIRRADYVGAAGPLGTRSPPLMLRVEGHELKDESIRALRERVLATPDDDAVAVPLALLLQLATAPLADDATAAEVSTQVAMRQVILDRWPTLDPKLQAWLIGITPTDRMQWALADLVRTSRDRWVRVAFILMHVVTKSDPIIAESLASDDELIRRVAALYVEQFDLLNEAARRRLLEQGTTGQP